MVQMWIGYLLILVGVILIVAGALAWASVIKIQRTGSTVFDFLIELLRHAPWVVLVGLVLIYIGCKMIGVALPP